MWRATGLLKYLHTWTDLWRGTQSGDERRVGLFLASNQVDVSLWAKRCLSARAKRPFVTFLGPVTFHGLGKNYIGSKLWFPPRTLSSSGTARRDGGGYFLPLELGARIELLDHLVICSEYVTPSQLSLQSGLGRHARLCSLRQWFRRNGWTRFLQLRASSPVLGSRRGVDGSHRTQASPAARRWLCRRQRFSSVSGWEACGVSRDPSCSSNGDLDDAKEGIVWWCDM